MAPSPAGLTKCERCPLRRQQAFRGFSRDELDFVQDFKQGELEVAAGTTIYAEGSESAHLYTVLAGWAFRYKLLEDGRRQILNYALPGDLLGLQTAVLGSLEHSAEALSDLKLCVFERKRVFDLFAQFPSLAFDVTWLASREERLLDESLISIGRRTAVERIANLLLALIERGRMAGLENGNSLRVPLTQYHIADSLGLSLVHTNRTLRRLAKDGLVSWRPSEVDVLEPGELGRLAGRQTDSRMPRPFI